MSLRKLFLTLGLLLLIGVWGACVDVPNGPVTKINPDFRSQARFVHAIPGGAAGDVKVDGATIGNIALGAATGYSDIASGTRSVAFGASAAQNLSFGSEQQSTFVIYSDPTGATAYLNLIEGHKDKNNGKVGTAKVKFVNVAQGSANVTFREGSLTGANLVSDAAYASARVYSEVAAGPRAVYAISNGGYLVTSIGGANEVPAVVGNLSSGDANVSLLIDSLAYVVNVKAQNSRGLFTAAHIHNAAAGANGPVLHTVSTDSQNVTFGTVATFTGAAENPPVTTNSTGTARFHLNSKNGFFYNLSVTRDNTVGPSGFYNAAHIHRGPVGTNGPVVFPLTLPADAARASYLSDSLRARNEPAPADTNSKAGGLGTFTLYADSLVYSIVVARRTEAVDTTFTAMHFHNAAAGANGPVVRTIQSTPWSNATRTFTGTWKRTDAEPLTDALITALVNGQIYLNAHTTVRPGGAIRSQLRISPTTTFAISGSWNTATLTPAMKDSIARGQAYVNFHSAANPGGQIRAQAVPDTFTVSTLRGFWNIPRDSTRIKEDFNLGRMYFNFHTLTNPGGEIRGQINVDPARGQYGTASLPSASYDDAKMYTIIATGKGATFQLIRLEDRQVSGTPVGKPAPAPPKKTVSADAN